MSEPIKVGDLVVVVKPPRCGCESKVLGLIYRVESIREGNGRCRCGCPSGPGLLYRGPDNFPRLPAWRLKRIPPLAELEGVKTEEDIREPA